MIGSSLNRYWSGDYVLWDLEAEGLNLAVHRPWQVAWAIASLKDGIKSIHVHYPYWKDLAVSKDAARITRFDPVLYQKRARPAKDVLTEFRAALLDPNSRSIFQSGFGYDSYILDNWCRGVGVPVDHSYLLRAIDTSGILKAKAKGWKPDMSDPQEWMAWQYSAYNWREKGLKTNLTDIGKARQIDHDYSTTHDAESDITLMWKIYREVVMEVEF